MSYSEFVAECFTLIFAKSGITNISSDDFVTMHGKRFYELFLEFFKFVNKFTVTQLSLDQLSVSLFITQKYDQTNKTKTNKINIYDEMFKNFTIFLDFAMDNIIVVNVDTLFDGLSTQTTKFMTFYNTMEHKNCSVYGYSFCICCSDYYNFDDIIIEIKFYNDVYYQSEGDHILAVEEGEFDKVKEKQTKERKHKVQGKRRDYEQYVYNKGLNKKKREHTHTKQSKNKQHRDVMVS